MWVKCLDRHAADSVMPITPPPLPLRPFSRPALVLAMALAVGIVLAARFSSLPFGVWAGLLTAAIGVALIAGFISRRRLVSLKRLTLAIVVGFAATSVGGLRMSVWQHLLENDITFLAAAAEAHEDSTGEATITLWGHIDKPPESLTYGTRFVLAVDSAARSAGSQIVRGRVQVLLGKSRYGASAVFPELHTGDRVEVTGDLRPVPQKRNPADFDYGAFLQRRGIHGTMGIYEAGAIAFLGSDAGPMDALVTTSRRHVRRSIHRFVRGEGNRAVLFALILADRRGIDSETLTTFVETGLMHLLAVSGLHVLLVGLLLYQLLKPVLGRLRLSWKHIEFTRAAFTLILLLFYLLITGGTVSVQRAFIMTAVWIGATLLQRQSDALNTLGVAAVIILLIRPAALFDVGFQLSFAAVGALVTLTPLMNHRIPEAWQRQPVVRWVLSMTVVSIAATLGTAPVLLYHFGRVPLAGLLLNLAAIPATAVALFGGLFTVVFAWFPVVADTFAAVAELGAAGLLITSRTGAQHLGWALVEGFVREGWLVMSMVLGLGALALWKRPRTRWVLVAGGLSCLAVSLWMGVARGDAIPHLDVIFLDVGQGDATLISLPNGRHLLVDAGLRDPYTDQGMRTVLPHLRRYGIRRLDAVVLTHADADHYGGVFSVMEEVEVGQLIYNGHQKENSFWLSVLHTADSLGVPLHIVQAGDTLALDPNVRIRILHPTETPAPFEDGNDASVVLYLEYGATSFLLTGDVEALGESEMVARYGNLLAANVVKVAHHGSRTSSTEAFVQAASDSSTVYAIISVARRNRYGLPNEEPLAHWQATSAEVLQTSREGAVWLRSDGERIERVHWR